MTMASAYALTCLARAALLCAWDTCLVHAASCNRSFAASVAAADAALGCPGLGLRQAHRDRCRCGGTIHQCVHVSGEISVHRVCHLIDIRTNRQFLTSLFLQRLPSCLPCATNQLLPSPPTSALLAAPPTSRLPPHLVASSSACTLSSALRSAWPSPDTSRAEASQRLRVAASWACNWACTTLCAQT